MFEVSVTLTFLALLIELLVGYPDRLVGAIGHPVTWIGALIARLDAGLNRNDTSPPARRLAGAATTAIVIVVAAAAGTLSERALLMLPFGVLCAALAASSLLAQRSLYVHVAAVAAALEHDGLVAGRIAVAKIVGRDPQKLDEAGVARAAIESLAENFCDGIVAPVFWMALAGLPGAAVYKAINTADSMIGHRTPRHQAFGWAAARLDDLVNLPASRLAALLVVGAAGLGGRTAEAWHAVSRDARRHRSPNAGYPEAAFAGALGLALAGPRVYGGVTVDDALMGNGRRAATAADIRAALALYRRADALLIALVGMLTLIATA
ncbi:MAG: cobalamin biosynthesis protein CobD [Xanthobacteraceae bacterium]|nr:cobalamin biosynthesis protein CobD [Xanthobacteraceae bacterium]